MLPCPAAPLALPRLPPRAACFVFPCSLSASGALQLARPFPVAQLGGAASLWGAWVLGPRIGRFDAAGNPVEMPGHNASLTLLGVFMLWFGWYGFNPGSTNAILNNASGYFEAGGYSQVVAAAAVNTTISAGAGAVFTLFTSMIHQYMTLGVPVWDLIIAGNGALAGLVGITGERACPRCRCLCLWRHAAPRLRRSFLSAWPRRPAAPGHSLPTLPADLCAVLCPPPLLQAVPRWSTPGRPTSSA